MEESYIRDYQIKLLEQNKKHQQEQQNKSIITTILLIIFAPIVFILALVLQLGMSKD